MTREDTPKVISDDNPTASAVAPTATAHTPGPWVAECCTLREAKDDDQFTWMSMGDGPYQRPPEFRVGMVWQQVKGGGTTGLPGSIETTEANAHLIAAAPDLLAALKALLAECGGSDDVRIAAEAALAKAEGR